MPRRPLPGQGRLSRPWTINSRRSLSFSSSPSHESCEELCKIQSIVREDHQDFYMHGMQENGSDLLPVDSESCPAPDCIHSRQKLLRMRPALSKSDGCCVTIRCHSRRCVAGSRQRIGDEIRDSQAEALFGSGDVCQYKNELQTWVAKTQGRSVQKGDILYEEEIEDGQFLSTVTLKNAGLQEEAFRGTPKRRRVAAQQAAAKVALERVRGSNAPSTDHSSSDTSAPASGTVVSIVDCLSDGRTLKRQGGKRGGQRVAQETTTNQQEQLSLPLNNFVELLSDGRTLKRRSRPYGMRGGRRSEEVVHYPQQLAFHPASDSPRAYGGG